ncbi:hypothetical protein MP228_007614 [Amoeboaphelidium protococcarum]|nr:hypothetical protein MP228_007614 [Amoeboaphelidium protococcarum]
MVSSQIIWNGEQSGEHYIIELQGVLEDIQEGFELGELIECNPEHNNQTTLSIGSGILIGKKVELKNPFLLLQSIHNEDDAEHDDQQQRALQIEDVIRTKYFFNTRPQHFISQRVKNKMNI